MSTLTGITNDMLSSTNLSLISLHLVHIWSPAPFSLRARPRDEKRGSRMQACVTCGEWLG
jgi:hypothetical protein